MSGSKLQDSVQTTDNPFDERKTIVGLGNKRKKNRQQNKFQKGKRKDRERTSSKYSHNNPAGSEFCNKCGSSSN
jgi:hypothetical protein